ncbi:glycoside hydrolase family 16 protein [Draconibacterium sp. IB214405]|uniref:glycoside hydrolase family 16 protein n=1 Tax=Draconibacterium sp. IB214405 TaxID=3097352 RepID=UPI002A1149A3|nr:glycoside hydrolase family 16 protein [Draconibacterium sp. IB214405]MDX8341005.1 glycoside hydrolase family 16 protein [Draconibacterium sp. IB214405]
MTRMKNTINVFYRLLLSCICLFGGNKLVVAQFPAKISVDESNHQKSGFELVWEDNFDIDGHPNSQNWTYEYGFVRNRELQWYQPQNANCANGILKIEARREKTFNPNYNPLSDDWRLNRANAEYTSTCLITKGLQEWPVNGYFEIRAKIDISNGSWPAIWLLGTEKYWPDCGEIDIMEFYRIKDVPHLLANAAWGSSYQNQASWDDAKIPLLYFTASDPLWAEKFHIWSMNWDSEKISIYLDDELMNEIDLKKTVNTDGYNPFTSNQKFYLLLNLAIGANGGDPDQTTFPLKFEVDYVRVYKQNQNTN